MNEPPVSTDLERRRARLTAALGFALIDTKGKPAPKEVLLVREWLDNWKGIGHVVAGMEHSLTSRTASAWEPTPWRAVQVAAWEALTKPEEQPPTPAEDISLP